MRKLLLVILLAFGVVPAYGAVRVWQSTLTLPTYEEGPPDENPPFEFFKASQNYPYTIRRNFTSNRANKTWRTLEIENEYLKCIVLPDLGGRVYSCTDKINRREMFYANTVVKKEPFAYRGAFWAAGVAPNFPVAHNWINVSPVDFATVQNPDGSASIFTGNTDLVEGMRWLVENILRPGAAALEQRVTLTNPTALRRRYLWWNNAGIEAAPDTRFYYPAHLTASHALADIDTWPVDHAGVDESALANHTHGDVARFTYSSREPFMGVYSRQRDSGTVHYADPSVVPGKKVWTWGAGTYGAAISKQVTDDGTIYVEMQAGLFENQETYGLMEPRQSIAFTEYWMPVRGLGGITRSSLDAAIFVEKISDKGQPAFKIHLNVFRIIPRAKIQFLVGDKVALEEQADLTPASTFTRSVLNGAAGVKYKLALMDASGKLLLSHTEDEMDATPASAVKLGDQPAYQVPPSEKRTEAQALEIGSSEERQGTLLAARATYQAAIRISPDSAALNKATGRLLVTLLQYEESKWFLSKAAPDPEARFYLGVAYARTGDDAKARIEFEAARADKTVGAAAVVELAFLLARGGDAKSAIALLPSESATPGTGGLQVALLRHLGDSGQAAKRLEYWLARDPADSLLQFEHVKQGDSGHALWRHLAASPERVLDAAAYYMDAGLYSDAVNLLAYNYPPADPLETEPGSVLPQEDPLVSYYRGYCRQKAGANGKPDFALAAQQSTLYVFPHRPQSFAVLDAALKANPSDAAAHFLLGCLQMSTGVPTLAFNEWQQAYKLNARFPTLHALLGRVLLDVKKDPTAALKVFREGMAIDPRNAIVQDDVRKALTGAVVAPKSPEKQPASARLGPAEMASLALSMIESGRIQEAADVFNEKNFPNEKQSQVVREAFVEVRVATLFAAAKAKRCDVALLGIEAIGDEDKAVPFTMYGFGAILKTARLQYAFAQLESLCGEAKAARKRWSKLAKLAGREPSLDFVYGHLAAAKLGEDKQNLEKTLQQLKQTNSPELTYAKGLLQQAMGRQKEAQASFQDAAKHAGDNILLRHLAQSTLY
ncbi:MAG: DUF5107 domain-containing protein [Bryobacteraceae bacterium]